MEYLQDSGASRIMELSAHSKVIAGEIKNGQ
jgi:hypothetical protein